MPSQLNSNAASWKQEVNRRVAAHRNRKGPVCVEPERLPKTTSSKTAEVLARVNARYAKAPSYNTALAEDARAVVRAAEAATRAAVEAQEAAETMLAGIEAVADLEEPEPSAAAAQSVAAPSYEVRWDEQLPQPAAEPAAWADSRQQAAVLVPQSWQGTAEPESVLETPDIEVVDGGHPIPANLIEFPRELVATRKARRSYEEPAPEEPAPETQLSIFEVDPAELTPLIDEPVAADPEPYAYQQPGEEPRYPVYAEAASAPSRSFEPAQPVYTEPGYAQSYYAETSSAPAAEATTYAQPPYDPAAYAAEPYPDALTPRRVEDEEPAQTARRQRPLRRPVVRNVHSSELDVAPFSTRMLAGVVNLSLMTMGLVVAGLTAARCNIALPSLQNLAAGAAVAMALIGLLYTGLFYLLSDSTPGMRYAHLRLVNRYGRRATRSERFVRLGCLVFSTVFCGLGFAWMLFDRDRLCWHDRLSGTYLRRY